jgi:hypothetical protein
MQCYYSPIFRASSENTAVNLLRKGLEESGCGLFQCVMTEIASIRSQAED